MAGGSGQYGAQRVGVRGLGSELDITHVRGRYVGVTAVVGIDQPGRNALGDAQSADLGSVGSLTSGAVVIARVAAARGRDTNRGKIGAGREKQLPNVGSSNCSLIPSAEPNGR